jgi:broad specificity phosphatase PhoE
MKAIGLAMVAFLATPAHVRPACPAGLQPARTAELFFGLEEGGRLLSDAEWNGFLDAEVTPRFPDGLTVWDARGQWRPPNGKLTHEPSRVMLIVLTGRHDERARLAAVIGAYKTRFHQQSVLLVEHSDCASF